MWGRAGRRRDGLAVYLAGIDGLDQFFCRHPTEFLTRPVEAAILDHRNERIQSAHLVAAAFEAPLGGPRDDEILGAGWRERADALTTHGYLRKGRGGLLAVRGSEYPAGGISLRSGLGRLGDRRRCRLRRAARARSRPSAPSRPSIRAPSTSTSAAPTRSASSIWTGAARSSSRSAATGTRSRVRRRRSTSSGSRRSARRSGVELHFGVVSVSEQVVAFQRKRIGDGHGDEAFDFVALDLPEQSFATQALWYVLPEELVGPAALPPEAMLGSLHASEHTQIAVLPLLAMCDRWDIGGLSTNVHMQTGRPTIFIYDGHPGGVGISRRGYEEFERLVGDAARLVGECPCEDGCPSCVQSPKCGNLNDHLHKGGIDRADDADVEPRRGRR